MHSPTADTILSRRPSFLFGCRFRYKTGVCAYVVEFNFRRSRKPKKTTHPTRQRNTDQIRLNGPDQISQPGATSGEGTSAFIQTALLPSLAFALPSAKPTSPRPDNPDPGTNAGSAARLGRHRCPVLSRTDKTVVHRNRHGPFLADDSVPNAQG